MRTTVIKLFILSFFLCFSNYTSIAQLNPPQGFNYQGIARDQFGIELATTALQVKISITNADSTLLFWEEEHQVTTNEFGLFTLVIGKGTGTGQAINASFSDIDWSLQELYLGVKIDKGNGYVNVGHTQLFSVPYALYAGDVANGKSGSTGATGPTGPAGANGGATGPTGPTGSSGDIGATGPTGANGAMGVTGPTGSNGANGSNGATGATGPAGANGGATGPTGANGATGATGPTGVAGSNGTNGATGPTGAAGSNGTNGSNGATGVTGPTGQAGTNGTNGATGITGPTGAAGSNGANGTNGVTGVTGSTGAAGSNGSNGVTGATGPTGAAGSNGSDGINGVTGPTGLTGAAGSNGSNGATGATGPSGANGTNGSNGVTGATGATGPSGADGSSNAWSLTGNASITESTNFIGTTDSKSLIFKTNGSERMRILSGGNMGIGTSSPSYALQVEASYTDDVVAFFGHTSSVTRDASIEISSSSNEESKIIFSENGTQRWAIYNDGDYADYLKLAYISGGTIYDNIVITPSVSSPRMGIGRTPSSNSLEVNGDASKSSAGSWSGNSDQRLKTNIQGLSSEKMLENILSLRGVSFEWNDTLTTYKNSRPAGAQTGFIAQEVQKVFPALVKKDGEGYLEMPYGTFDPFLVEAIKAQQKIIEEQKARIDELSKSVNSINSKMEALEKKLNSSIGQNQSYTEK